MSTTHLRFWVIRVWVGLVLDHLISSSMRFRVISDQAGSSQVLLFCHVLFYVRSNFESSGFKIFFFQKYILISQCQVLIFNYVMINLTFQFDFSQYATQLIL
jgi:hypothetical protein